MQNKHTLKQKSEPATDTTWERIGITFPYYGVLTDRRYKTENLNEGVLKDFFTSGEEYVNNLLNKLKLFFPLADIDKFKEVLDFGCGTGRLLIPFAKRCEQVTGVDIAHSMLREANKNLKERGLKNVTLIQTEDIAKINFPSSFDLVHTYVVLQHIPRQIGYTIIDKLISIVKEDGYGVIHFTYANNKSAFVNKINAAKANYNWFNKISNVLKGRNFDTPFIQMNNYDLRTVFKILWQHNIKRTSIDFTNHGGCLGLFIYFQK